MTDTDVIIIGAGVSGLMAAREASRKGRKVTLLEARGRTGGRIFTSLPQGFNSPVEEGAEFIHGELPLTASLLKEAGLGSYSMEGKTYYMEQGHLKESDEFIEGFPELISKLEELKEDMTFRDFLEKYFSGKEYDELRSSVISYAQGYDASDISRVSSIALREEWKNESEEAPERIKGGYRRLVDFLASECRKSGCSIHLSSVVKLIRWKEGSVEVTCEDGKVFQAQKALITVPLGVLISPPESRGHIKFEPEIPHAFKAFNSMGFGRVVKIFLEFKSVFWEDSIAPGLGFLLSDAGIPTWWTQLPSHLPVITGWIAGPSSEDISQMSESEIIDKALGALSYIFGQSPESLKDKLVSGRAADWNHDPFTLGAYSYKTLGTKNAIREASEAVKDTIYFAGEAFYEGYAMGTVEAALTTGRDAAAKL
ncbi:MAG TPA: NAD(P)/FAD-dependent oxidoreductase [Ignavibacteriales bacterium]|nr:NAD(P)/FAD-dependent oxidoreductase [Ignavibacteriales bacterium]